MNDDSNECRVGVVAAKALKLPHSAFISLIKLHYGSDAGNWNERESHCVRLWETLLKNELLKEVCGYAHG